MHGDLHPGNMMIADHTERGHHGPQIIFLDAGIVSELGKADRKNFIDLFYAIAKGDGRAAGRLMIERVSATAHLIHEALLYIQKYRGISCSALTALWSPCMTACCLPP